MYIIFEPKDDLYQFVCAERRGNRWVDLYTKQLCVDKKFELRFRISDDEKHLLLLASENNDKKEFQMTYYQLDFTCQKGSRTLQSYGNFQELAKPPEKTKRQRKEKKRNTKKQKK